MGLVAIQSPLLLFYSSFGCPLKLSLLAARVPKPFHIHAKRKFGKKRVNSFLARFVTTTTQLQSQCTTNSTNTCLVIIPKILGLQYHYPHSNISLKIMHKLK